MSMFRSIVVGVLAFAVTATLIVAESRLFDAAISG